jgi:putative flippase GtrA
MTLAARVKNLADWVVAAWKQRAIALKAASFAMVGVVNTAVDYSVFLLMRWLLASSAAVTAAIAALIDLCHCGSVNVSILIIANLIAWIIAVSGSYVMNSFFTFAAESGRKLRVKAYASFVASGIAGVITNTTTLVIAAHFLPVPLAKLLAIGASFLVNFSLSHFVVFRPHGATRAAPQRDALRSARE